MAMVNPEIKRRMESEIDEETVIMKSQMQEVEERQNRNNDIKAQKKLKEKSEYARDGAIEKVTRPNGAEHYRRAGKTAKEKEELRKEKKRERVASKSVKLDD